MEINAINAGVVLAGIVLANWGIKFGKAMPLLRKAHELTKNQVIARGDGKLTKEEKAVLYDDIEALVKEAYSIIRGLFPNRS